MIYWKPTWLGCSDSTHRDSKIDLIGNITVLHEVTR